MPLKRCVADLNLYSFKFDAWEPGVAQPARTLAEVGPISFVTVMTPSFCRSGSSSFVLQTN